MMKKKYVYFYLKNMVKFRFILKLTVFLNVMETP